jgi:hypothetical protein
MQGISWLAENRLVSQEEFCSVEQVSENFSCKVYRPESLRNNLSGPPPFPIPIFSPDDQNSYLFDVLLQTSNSSSERMWWIARWVTVWLTNWNARGNKRSWPDLRCHPGICQEGMRTTVINGFRGQDLKPMSPKYEEGVVTATLATRTAGVTVHKTVFQNDTALLKAVYDRPSSVCELYLCCSYIRTAKEIINDTQTRWKANFCSDVIYIDKQRHDCRQLNLPRSDRAARLTRESGFDCCKVQRLYCVQRGSGF